MYNLEYLKADLLVVLSWLCTIYGYTIENFQSGLHIISTIAAITASVYAIRVHRKTLKRHKEDKSNE